MAHSYQLIDERMTTVEHKLDFMMKLAQVTKKEPSVLMPGEFVVRQMTMLDLYHEINAAGLELELKDPINDGQ